MRLIQKGTPFRRSAAERRAAVAGAWRQSLPTATRPIAAPEASLKSKPGIRGHGPIMSWLTKLGFKQYETLDPL
jgi:hypothetical protein